MVSDHPDMELDTYTRWGEERVRLHVQDKRGSICTYSYSGGHVCKVTPVG